MFFSAYFHLAAFCLLHTILLLSSVAFYSVPLPLFSISSIALKSLYFSSLLFLLSSVAVYRAFLFLYVLFSPIPSSCILLNFLLFLIFCFFSFLVFSCLCPLFHLQFNLLFYFFFFCAALHSFPCDSKQFCSL